MTFVMLTDHKTSVPLSEVKLVEEPKGERVLLTMRDGSSFETFKHLWKQAVEGQFQSVVPAAAGTLLICEVEAGYVPGEFEPVVGWGVTGFGAVVPLTHYGTPDDTDAHVLHPDGRVSNSGGGIYASLEEFLAARAERDALMDAA